MWDDSGNYLATECNRELSILLPFGGFFSTICPWALQVITYYENMDIDRSQQSHHATLAKKISFILRAHPLSTQSRLTRWRSALSACFQLVQMLFHSVQLCCNGVLSSRLSAYILESKIGLWRSIFISAWCIFHARDRQVTEIRERALHVNGLNFERPSCSKTLSTLVNILSL